MKVFLPVTDSLLAEYGATQLVPFDPNFLIPNENEEEAKYLDYR